MTNYSLRKAIALECWKEICGTLGKTFVPRTTSEECIAAALNEYAEKLLEATLELLATPSEPVRDCNCSFGYGRTRIRNPECEFHEEEDFQREVGARLKIGEVVKDGQDPDRV